MTRKKKDNVVDLKVAKTPDWKKELQRSASTKTPLCNHTNVMVFLRNDPDLKDAFAYDEMYRSEMLMQPLGRKAPKDWSPQPATDVDALIVQEMLQKRQLQNVAIATVNNALTQRAHELSFHPVRDYLEALPKHDRTARLDRWLVTYLGAEDTPYSRAAGRMFLISMIARVMEPGCKVDYTLILEGEQGVEKSKIGAVLGGQWFSDSLPDIRLGKEASQHLRGKWLIEMAELHARRQADENLLKSFMTRQTERYRPPFGRKEVSEPRQCVFIGTTNELADYLKDQTGNRRDWPIRVGKIDIEALKRDRDQLFAEALKAYRSGEQWWPKREFEQEQIQPEQEKRRAVDPWEEAIRSWLDRFLKIGGDPREKCVGLGTILGLALDKPQKDQGTNDYRRAAGIMNRLEWLRSSVQGKGWLQGKFFWVPPGVSEEEALSAMPEKAPIFPQWQGREF